MKFHPANIILLFSIPSAFIHAESSVKLENVHLCCKACVRGVESAVAGVEGASAKADQETGVVVITAADKKTVRQGVNAMMRGGFYGTSTDASIKVRDISGAEDGTVKSATITGVHLCCGGCVDAVADALATVKGVSGNTAEKKQPAFDVTGEFNPKEVIAALNKAGFTGRLK